MKTVGERISSQDELLRRFGDNLLANLRVAMPGIIQSFDAATQTVTVQPAIRERIRDIDGNVQIIDLPILLDVPVVMPRAGDFAITFPIRSGDECLVVFADMCIDSWWQSGGIQNQAEKRRHDLSDAFAIIGAWSQPHKIPNYSESSMQLRTLDGDTYISLEPGEIDIQATCVTINGINFSTHKHGGVQTGIGETSGPE